MNLFDYRIPDEGETFTSLLEKKGIKINRIVSSDILEPVEYIQEEDEWLVLLEGQATLLIEGETKIVTKGDTLFIPAGTPHTVLKTAHGTLWLTVHIY
jgi:cupin 2 domain-containing protein